MQAIAPCAQVIAAPVRPPMRDTALPAEFAMPLTALPAELVTRVRPCWAFEAVSDAPSLALFAVEDTASEVEDCARR